MVFELRWNTVDAHNSWVGFIEGPTYEFFTIEDAYIYFKDNSKEFFGQTNWYFVGWFLEDEGKVTVERQVLTLYEVFGEFGGILELVVITAAFFSGNVQSFLYESNLISKMFMETVQTNPDNDNRPSIT